MFGETPLQRSDVPVAQREVIQEVPGAQPVVRVHLTHRERETLADGVGVRGNTVQLFDEPVQSGVGHRDRPFPPRQG